MSKATPQMPNNIESATHQTPEIEDFVMSPEEAQSLSSEEVAQKRVEFYKSLLKRERASKHVEKKEDLPNQAKPAPNDLEKRLDETERRIEWKAEMRSQGYTPEDIREIEAYSKGAGLSLEDATKSPFVQAAITARRQESQSKEATLDPSTRSVMVGDKSAKDVLSDPSASLADKQAAANAIMRTAMNKR